MDSVQVLELLQRKYGSADWSKWSMHRWTYWDYVRLTNAGTSQLQFFTNPRGATDPVSATAKTLEQTNMPKARSFGQVYYLIEQIRTHIHVLPKNRQAAGISSDADVLTSADGMVLITPELEELSNVGVLEIDIAAKNYIQINKPFRQCPPGMGVEISQHAASGVTESAWWQQNASRRNVYELAPPQIIEPEQSFDARIKFAEANSPTFPQVASADVRIDVGLIFDGYIVRPAQ